MDKVVKPVTVRFTEENYESVKKYAEKNKEGLSDAVNRVVKKFFSDRNLGESFDRTETRASRFAVLRAYTTGSHWKLAIRKLIP